MPQTWDRNAALNELRNSNLPANDLIIKKMWIYHHDFEIQGDVFASAKTYYERMKATLMVSLMAADLNGKKMSAAAAETEAEADTDVWKAALAYRKAEQMVTADREALKILQAQLDDWRTRRADERAADQFQARTQT